MGACKLYPQQRRPGYGLPDRPDWRLEMQVTCIRDDRPRQNPAYAPVIYDSRTAFTGGFFAIGTTSSLRQTVFRGCCVLSLYIIRYSARSLLPFWHLQNLRKSCILINEKRRCYAFMTALEQYLGGLSDKRVGVIGAGVSNMPLIRMLRPPACA